MKAAVLSVVMTGLAVAWPMAQSRPQGVTAIEGIRVGHHTLTERPTGCTVVLVEKGATGGVAIRGSAPGTRETDLLDPSNLVEQVHAIVFAGGSAFGLDAASGVMRYLEERKVGFPFGGAYVPIVPAAVLFDLPVGGKPMIRPDASCGYAAAKAATDGPIAEGSVGAGAGATVGKFGGFGNAMKGGIGTASITLPSGLTVAALVAVNAAGDIVDPSTGRIVAGVRGPDGKTFVDARTILRTGVTAPQRPGESRRWASSPPTRASPGTGAQDRGDGTRRFARAIVPATERRRHDLRDWHRRVHRRRQHHDPRRSGGRNDAGRDPARGREATGVPNFPAIRDLGRK